MTTFSETSLPALIFTVPAPHPKGDVPALGRLTVNELQAVNQAWLVWGQETNDLYDITASTAALFYEAEGRTLLSGSSVVTLAGSSGGGTNNAIESTALPPFDIPILSTQATGAGAHLTHVGSFRVFARVMNTAAATGSVIVRMEWAVGDFATFTRNDSVTLTAGNAGTFQIVDLGLVTIPLTKTGPQRWQGVVIAQADGGDKLRVDCIFLVPVDFGSGEITASAQAPSTAAPSIYDTFDQTAGALAGKVTTSGQTWTFQTGDVDDFQVDATNHYITRTTTADTARRIMSAGTGTFTALTAQVDINYPASDTGTVSSGLVLRYVDASNFLRIGPRRGVVPSRFTDMFVETVIAGVSTFWSDSSTQADATWYTLTASVDAAGRLRVWWNPRGAQLGTPVYDAALTSLATGGALASGKVGIQELSSSSTLAKLYDNFVVTVPSAVTQSAVLYASQSVDIRHDSVIREDSTGTLWQPVASYEGDLLKVPPAGREQRSVRFIVKASRNVLGGGPDSGIDDISATLALTPRYLSVPTPS